MSDTSANLLPRYRVIGIFVLLLAALAGRAIFLVLPVNSDTAMFVYAGKLVAEGGRPGIDLLDNKLPTVGLLMSVPWRYFGANWPAYAAAGLIFSLGSVFVLWRVTRELWGESAAITVAVAACAWLNFPPAVYGALQLEIIQTFLAALAAACALRILHKTDWRDAFTLGLCGGLAMWAKPTGGAAMAAAALMIGFVGRDRIKMLAWIGLGASVPILLAVWLIVCTGMGDGLPATLRQLHDYAAGSSLEPMDLAKPLLVLALLGFPVLVIGGVYRRQPHESNADRRSVAFVSLWLAAELAGVISQRRMYAYHFLPLGPPAALAAGLVARHVRVRVLAMAFGPVVAVTLLLACSAWLERAADSRGDRLVAYVRTHANANDAVWTDDYPRLLTEADCRPGSAVPLLFLMANGDTAPDFFGHKLLTDFAARRPTLIAFPADPSRLIDLYRHHMADVAASPVRADAIARQINAILAYLHANYRPEADLDGTRLWRRATVPTPDSVAAGGELGR